MDANHLPDTQPWMNCQMHWEYLIYWYTDVDTKTNDPSVSATVGCVCLLLCVYVPVEQPLFCVCVRFRSCWVCFATDEDDRTAEWVRPCRCRGSTKWVHQVCLQRWVDEKQRGNSTARVACPQCNAEYLIVFPKLGMIWQGGGLWAGLQFPWNISWR